MKLVFGENEVEVTFKTPSFKIKRTFIELYKNISAVEKQGRVNRYLCDNIGEGSTLDDKEMQGLIAKGLENKNLSIKDLLTIEDAETFLNDTTVQLEAFKLIVQTKQLTTEQKQLFDEPVDGDFWSEQDLEEVAKAVNSFRFRLGISRY